MIKKCSIYLQTKATINEIEYESLKVENNCFHFYLPNKDEYIFPISAVIWIKLITEDEKVIQQTKTTTVTEFNLCAQSCTMICPYCGAHVEKPIGYIGHFVKCPTCSREFKLNKEE